MAPDMGHGPKPDGAETGPSSVQAAPVEGVKATRIAAEGLRGAVATAGALVMVATTPPVPHEATGKERLALGHVRPNDGVRPARLTSQASGIGTVVPIPTRRGGTPTKVRPIPRRVP